jgi:outer membrane lipoprotein SlyB
MSVGDGIGDAIADAALGAVGGFIGRAIGRRVQKAMSERVMPTLAANRETTLRQQIEIAQRHPDLRACLTDKVVFLAGGSHVLPMPNLMAVTAGQADAMVAQLRSG